MSTQTDLINQGAAVKGYPGTSAADLILQAEAIPLAMPTTALTTPIVPMMAPAAVSEPAPNVMPLQQPANNTGTVVLIGAGLGAIWLLSEGKNGAAISGKEKKKKGKSSMLPILLVGGAAAAYLYFKNSNTAAATDNTTVLPGGGTTATNDTTTTNQGINFVPATLPTTDSAIYNQLFNYSVPWRYAVDRMTTDERKTLYLYVYGYITKHLRLYNFPGSFPDGNYDPVLYQAVSALSQKWQLGLLN